MGSMELCWLLDRRLLQHQYLDDIEFDDHQWSLLVAELDLRLARVFYCGLFHLLDGTYRRHISYWIPRRQSIVLWNLGCTMARIQSSRNGMCMVRSTSLDWRWVALCSIRSWYIVKKLELFMASFRAINNISTTFRFVISVIIFNASASSWKTRSNKQH